MKKKIATISLLLLGAAACMAFAGCKDKEEGMIPPAAEEGVSISLSTSAMTMDIYDELSLRAVTNSEEEVVWATSDSTVVTVEDGVLKSAGKLGTANITATVEGKTATCAVTTQIQSIPELTLSVETITLNKLLDEEFTVISTLTYNGTDISEEYPVTWAISENGTNGVAELTSVESGNAIFKALTIGETEYVAFVRMGGNIVSKSVSVRTIELSTVYSVLGTTPCDNGFRVELFTYEGQRECTPIVEAHDLLSGEKTVLNYEWTCEDDCVALLDGTIVARRAGEAVLTGTCDGYEDLTLYVDVVKPTVRIEDDFGFVLESKGTTAPSIEIASLNLIGTVEGVWYDGQNLFVSYDSMAQKVTLDGAKLPMASAKLGKQTLTVETDRLNYKVDATLYTKIFSEKEEFSNFGKYALTKDGVYDGYYILGNDIDVSGLQNVLTPFYNTYNDGLKYGFRGVLDGCGYALDGCSVAGTSNNALFGGVLHEFGVIKNILFTNVSLGGNASVISAFLYGSLQNVYFSFDSISAEANGSAICGAWKQGANPRIESCFVDYGNVRIDAPNYYPTTKQYSNMHTIYTMARGTYTTTNANNGSSVLNGKHYDSYAKIIADGSAQKAFAAWDNQFWDISLGVPFPKSIVNDVKEIANQSIVLQGSETVNGRPTLNAYTGEKMALEYSNDGYMSVTVSPEAKAAGITVKGTSVNLPDIGDGKLAGDYEITITSDFAPDNQLVFVLRVMEVNRINYRNGEAQEVDLDMQINSTASGTAKTAKANESKAVTFDLEKADVGELFAVKLNGVNLSDLSNFTLNGDELTILVKQFGTDIYGEQKLTVYTKNGNAYSAFEINLLLVTKYLTSEQELLNATKYAYQGGTVWAGYFKLTTDIDCNSATMSGFKGLFSSGKINADQARNGNENGFKGVFDGDGHVIRGYKSGTQLNGFFGATLSASSIVKNVVFTEAEVLVTNAGVIAALTFGTLENAYIEVVNVANNANAGAIAGVWDAGAKPVNKRVFIDYRKAGELNAPAFYPTTKQYSSTDVIYTLVSGDYCHSNSSSSEIWNGVHFATAEQMKNNLSAQAQFNAWDSSFWTVQDGVPTPKSLAS